MVASERIYLIEEADPIIFFGRNNRNLQLLKELHPKLRIMARGNLVKVMGEPTEMVAFLKLLHQLEEYVVEYNTLPESVVVELARGSQVSDTHVPKGTLLFGASGRSVVPKSQNQSEMIRLIEEHDLVFATGPAGTGKTFIAIAMAVKLLKTKQVRRIILSRPAVEAGEKLGFLPGEMKDKLDPYLQPLYDALQELIPAVRLKEYMENGTIQIAPLAFMRGRTLSEAVVILDEAQNTTPHQMKMFLTRLGLHTKMVVTGDMSQVDLPRGVLSGLRQAKQIVQGIPGVGWIEYQKEDIMRHKLVQSIVDAYDKHEAELRQKRDEHKGENSESLEREA